MIEAYSRSTAPFGWFVAELAAIHPDLRLRWGAESHGIELWVVERKLPDDVYASCLEDFAALYPGEDRWFDQQLMDDHGNVIGMRRFDRCPQWALGHIVQNPDYDVDDPRAYREPAAYDLAKIREWLFEYRNTEDQIREMRDAKDARDRKLKEERVGILARDIVSSRSTWGDEPLYDIGRKPAMEGTEL